MGRGHNPRAAVGSESQPNATTQEQLGARLKNARRDAQAIARGATERTIEKPCGKGNWRYFRTLGNAQEPPGLLPRRLLESDRYPLRITGSDTSNCSRAGGGAGGGSSTLVQKPPVNWKPSPLSNPLPSTSPLVPANLKLSPLPALYPLEILAQRRLSSLAERPDRGSANSRAVRHTAATRTAQ